MAGCDYFFRNSLAPTLVKDKILPPELIFQLQLTHLSGVLDDTAFELVNLLESLMLVIGTGLLATDSASTVHHHQRYSMNATSRLLPVLVLTLFGIAACSENDPLYVPVFPSTAETPPPTRGPIEVEPPMGSTTDDAPTESAPADAEPSADATGPAEADQPDPPRPTLEDVGVVGTPFAMVLNFGVDPRGRNGGCDFGDLCQAGVFIIRADGTYTWRSHVRVSGDFDSSGDVDCDDGEWREEDEGLVLLSCSGDSYQADWEIERDGHLRIGEYSMSASPASTNWSFPCGSPCAPFYGQFRP